MLNLFELLPRETTVLVTNNCDSITRAMLRHSCVLFRSIIGRDCCTKQQLPLAVTREGYLSILVWSVDYGCMVNERECRFSNSEQRTLVSSWIDLDSPYYGICNSAAFYGHLELLKYARRVLKCDWHTDTCAAAAFRGHLEVLMWLRSNKNQHIDTNCKCSKCKSIPEFQLLSSRSTWDKCPWDNRVCTYAIANNHKEVSTWASQNGAKFDKHIITNILQRRDCDTSYQDWIVTK